MFAYRIILKLICNQNIIWCILSRGSFPFYNQGGPRNTNPHQVMYNIYKTILLSKYISKLALWQIINSVNSINVKHTHCILKHTLLIIAEYAVHEGSIQKKGKWKSLKNKIKGSLRLKSPSNNMSFMLHLFGFASPTLGLSLI